MPTIQYRLLNVFAETSFGGNPLAVIEDGSALTDAEMQLIARQFNLSETTFLLPSDQAAARIRIFTPTYEMAFAGHPTLGSAQVVSDLLGAGKQFKIEMQAGLIPVWADNDRWTLAANPPKYRAMQASTSELAAMLNLPAEAISGPVVWVDCGTEQPMIPLTNAEYVQACRPDAALMARFSKNLNGQAKTYVFASTGAGFEARYFWMTGDSSVNEDPGTGSACANLGGWWLATNGSEPLDVIIHQARSINRPSLLSLKVDQGHIQVGGRVIQIGGGSLSW
ncbi:trans-2,3-dihydro-3-hydroxyanthranilate isomerase [Undibacterium sp. GrIS 1.8]|uniref:PhzF family phenazine biosynthesis protein n=1 Tax=unclassified Undibacterium TaxID=2630295 RepID=UPI003393EE3A